MFKTNPILLGDLLNDVETGSIQLPDFQRGWVWDDDRIRGLLASISRGFPVGAVMMLESGKNFRFKCRAVEGVSDNGAIPKEPNHFLLDGQQRLTSLYQALRYAGPVTTHDSRGKRIKRRYYINMIKALDTNPSSDREEAIVSVPENKKVTRDFGRETVWDLSSDELEYKQHMMPTERLLDTMDWVLEYINHWKNESVKHPRDDAATILKEFNNKVLNNFTKYLLPVISLNKETPKEAVCTVFEKVNTGGVTLTTFELVTAMFAAENFSLRDDWNARREHLHAKYGVLQGIEGEQFLQSVALLATQQSRRQAISLGKTPEQAPAIGCKKRDLLNLCLNDYNDWADKVESGFIEAAKFLHRQFVFEKRDVPYNTQLVPLAAIYAELGNELKPANATERLERWYWSGIFSEAYGGGTETQFALDLAQVTEYVRSSTEPRLVTEAGFSPERLISLSTRNSAAYKGLYALQMKCGAADWLTGKPLSLAIWHTENIDIHHIFPVAWCSHAQRGIERSLYNSVINKTPIDAWTNRIIGGHSPSHYLAKLDREIQNLDQVLQTHWLKPDLLRKDKFPESFVERGQAMFELINKAMGKQAVDGREAFRNALAAASLKDTFDEDVSDYDTVGDAVHSDTDRD